MRTYVIINSSEVSSFNFDVLVDNSEEESRKSLDGSKIVARFEGDTPSFLIGEPQYTQKEILPIMHSAEWTSDEII